MRITLVPTITEYEWGAPGHCMGALADLLLSERHKVQLFVAAIDRNNPSVENLKSKGAQVIILPCNHLCLSKLRRRLSKMTYWRTSGESLSRQIKAFQPHHIFVNQGGTWCAIYSDLKNILNDYKGKYSLICHLNHPMRPFSSSRLDDAASLFCNARNVFFNSRYSSQLAEEQLAFAIPNKSFYTYPHRFEFKSAAQWPESMYPKLAMVCRLDTFHKGIDLAFRCIASIRDQYLFSLTLFGSGPERDYLERLAGFFGIQDVVRFAGYEENVARVWRDNELLLLPSRHEGCSVAMTEAMGFGRPVIATSVGGAPEWIDDGVNGFLCPAAESHLLAPVIRRALENRASWREMGLRAHEKVKMKLSRDPAAAFLQALT